MKKVKIDGVSKKLILKIKLRDIARRLQKMSDAINGDTDVFTGTQPFDAVAITALIVSFLAAQGAYSVGGSLKRSDFFKKKKALYDCMLAFLPYVNKIANGNKVILDLSTLPLISDEPDYAKLIAEGATAKKITAVQGKYQRQIVTNCASFGLGVGYIVIVSEGALPDSFYIGSDGTLNIPTDIRCLVNSLGGRKKEFNNLLPKTEYFVYYVLTYGEFAGIISEGKSIVTSA